MTMWQQMAEAARTACNLETAANAPAPADERPPVPVRRAAS